MDSGQQGVLWTVLVLDQDIRYAFINKEAVIGVFLDIEKANDAMWRGEVLIKLRDADINDRMFNDKRFP